MKIQVINMVNGDLIDDWEPHIMPVPRQGELIKEVDETYKVWCVEYDRWMNVVNVLVKKTLG